MIKKFIINPQDVHFLWMLLYEHIDVYLDQPLFMY